MNVDNIIDEYFSKVLHIEGVRKYIPTELLNKCIKNPQLYNSNGHTQKNAIRKIKQIIDYKKRYNCIDNIKQSCYNECQICKKDIVHSINYKGNTNKINHSNILNSNTNISSSSIGVIYIEPANATNLNYYDVCHHFLIELDKCLRENEYFTLIFNMRNTKMKDYIKHLQIAYNIYKILKDCYMDELKNIYVTNLSMSLNIFTKFFAFSFNKKIKVRSFQYIRDNILQKISNYNTM